MSETVSERANVVKVTESGPSRKRLSIEVPAETVTEKLRESFDTLSVEAELPGFRRGRVPRWLVEKRFGPVVRREARGAIVASAYQRAIEDLKLRVVGEPSADGLENLELAEGKPFAFELEVEVMPTFELPTLEGIAVKKPTFDLGDSLVESELQKVAINEGTLESRPQAEPGDYITGHALMVGGDGTKFYDLNGAVVQSPTADRNGKGMILGVMVEDFSKQLGTPKAGETFTVKCKGPENHEVEKIRGADLTITFKVDRVDRIIPASMDQLVAAFGLENADRLKELVRRRLEQNAMIEQQTAMRQQVCKALLDATTMDLPERLSARQAARTLEQRRLELMYRGVDAQKIEEHMAELRASSSEIASRELKLFFLLAQAAEKLNIRVDDGEINSRIAQMAFQRNMRPEQLRAELMQSNQISGVYQQIRDHKTLDAILSKATVTEVPADEFNKQMESEAKAEAAPAGKKKK